MRTQLFGEVDYSIRGTGMDSTFKCKTLNVLTRVDFDPKNSEHRKAYTEYVKTGKWNLKFNIEWPSVTVPQSVMSKLAEYACSEEFQNAEKRQQKQQFKSVKLPQECIA